MDLCISSDWGDADDDIDGQLSEHSRGAGKPGEKPSERVKKNNCHPEPPQVKSFPAVGRIGFDLVVRDLMVIDIKKACLNNQISREVKIMRAYVQH